MLPKDIHMLVSYLNTKLRDEDMSVEHIIETQDENPDEIVSRVTENGYIYDKSIRQFKHR